MSDDRPIWQTNGTGRTAFPYVVCSAVVSQDDRIEAEGYLAQRLPKAGKMLPMRHPYSTRLSAKVYRLLRRIFGTNT